MPSRARRRLARIAAIVFAVALLVAAGHRHEQHQGVERGCAECVVAHHSPALLTVHTVTLAPSAAPPEILPTSPEHAAHRWHSLLEAGRAPPRPALA